MKTRPVYLYPGVFHRLYTFQDTGTIMPVYITSRQVYAVLEEDSAWVCSLLFSDPTGKGAYNYILHEGSYEDDVNKEQAALEIYDAFVDELASSGIISIQPIDLDSCLATAYTFSNEDLAGAYQQASNLELEFAQIMADHHKCYSMTLELTYECNERCIHCYCPSERKMQEMSIECISALLDEFTELGGYRLYITGGEIFMRPDIVELLRMLKSKYLVVDIGSNLTLLDTNPEFLPALIDLHPRSVGVSVYSADAAIHDRVTALPGSLEKTIKGITMLRAANIPVVLKTPLMSITIAGWQKVKNLAITLGCEYQFDLGITAGNDQSLEPTELRVKSREQIEDIFTKEFSHLYNKEEKATLNDQITGDIPICGAGVGGLTISPNGDIRPCIGIMEALGTYPADTLEQIWFCSEFFSKWNQQKWLQIPECSVCSVRRFCFKCPGSWQVETGSYTQPSAYTCYLANILKDCIIE